MNTCPHCGVVKTYCGGKPNYCTPIVDAVNMSQECVDETTKWVGLTDEEIFKLYMNSGYGDIDDCLQFEGLARVIEAKLKEKNYE